MLILIVYENYIELFLIFNILIRFFNFPEDIFEVLCVVN